MADLTGMFGELERILSEVSELRSALMQFEQTQASKSESVRFAMQQGIDAIRSAIEDTKSDLSTLQKGNKQGAKIDRATDELDAVVADTEAATEVILQAAETIESSVSKLGNLRGANKAVAEEISDQVIKIFEACNFQDISGQRIRKVVSLMQFVEERVSRMASIWGEAMEGEQESGDEREGDAALLNGPSLAKDDNVVSQDDIDSFFR
jgi:chemotaxis protein CheZ